MSEGGYGLGDVALNRRQLTAPELVSLGCKDSRVPDIELVGTHVGFNYDGHAHFAVGETADGQQAGTDAASVRAKYLDDLRRNRELAAMGRVVLPVTSEDLFQQGGLDAVMLEAVLIAEACPYCSASVSASSGRFFPGSTAMPTPAKSPTSLPASDIPARLSRR